MTESAIIRLMEAACRLGIVRLYVDGLEIETAPCAHPRSMPAPEFAAEEVNEEEGGGDLIPVVLRGMMPTTPNPLPASYLKAKAIEEACMKGSDEP